MKFCKKCHRRIVNKLDNSNQYSSDCVKICTCPGQGLLSVHRSVVKRYNSELGVHEVRKFVLWEKNRELEKIFPENRKKE